MHTKRMAESSDDATARGGASSVRRGHELQPGDVLAGRYEIEALLGRGAEGAVMRAMDLRAGARIALKLIPEEEVVPARLARLRKELALARRITHPNVVRTYDLVDAAGWVGLAMELVPGASLLDRLAIGPATSRDERWLLTLAEGLAAGLASAHAAGVVHRDLKPSNVLLAEPKPGTRGPMPKITDFGIARVAEDAPESARAGAGASVGATAVGHVIGTPLYMAPEQLAGLPAGPAADVYALGLVLYEAATGEVPLGGRDLAELRTSRAKKPPRLGSRRADLSRAFTAIVDRCLEPQVERRFADGAAVARALATAARGRRIAWLGIAALAAAGIAVAASGALRGPAKVGVPSAAPPSDVMRFEKKDLVVGEKRRFREVSKRTLTFTRPLPTTTETIDTMVRTSTVLAADRRVPLRVRLRYDEAWHEEVRFGEKTRTSLPVAGKTYVAEWRDGALVITDDQYRPVPDDEEAIVAKPARTLGTPSPELAATPDVPVRIGERADTLVEMLRGAMLRKGEMELTDLEVRLTSIERGADGDVGVFDVGFAGLGEDDAFGVGIGASGVLRMHASGRMRAITLRGQLELDGEDAAAKGTYEMTIEAEPEG